MQQATHDVSVIAYGTATDLIEKATSHASKNGWNVAVVVVDPWGATVASARMDGVSPTILEIAGDKAFTAAMGRSTLAFYERMSSSPELAMGLQNRKRFCAWEGAVPIRSNGKLVGAIGVSGATGPEDVSCAEFALAEMGLASEATE